MRVFVLGAGRAGSALASELVKRGAEVVGIHGRSAGRVGNLPVSAGAIPATVNSADIVLVTVRDSQLEAALSELLTVPLRDGAVVLHASGSLNPDGVEELRRRGHGAGTFHPLLPLAGDATNLSVTEGAWIGIDGDDRARDAAVKLAHLLGANVMAIPAGGKAAYHAAAVMASNFPCVLAYLARQLLAEAGVPAAQASAAVISLMHASVENLRGRDPAAALTGPVVRGDVGTVVAHLGALGGAPDAHAKSVYEALTLVAVEMARQIGADAAALREIEEAVARS